MFFVLEIFKICLVMDMGNVNYVFTREISQDSVEKTTDETTKLFLKTWFFFVCFTQSHH